MNAVEVVLLIEFTTTPTGIAPVNPDGVELTLMVNLAPENKAGLQSALIGHVAITAPKLMKLGALMLVPDAVLKERVISPIVIVVESTCVQSEETPIQDKVEPVVL